MLKAFVDTNILLRLLVRDDWGLDAGLSAAYTFDVREFGRIDGLAVRKP